MQICHKKQQQNKTKQKNSFVEPLYKGHAGGRDKKLSQRAGCFGVEVGCNLKPVLGRKGRVFVLVFLKASL